MTDQHMIRWKRTAKNQWYYLPQVFTTETEATAKAEWLNHSRNNTPPPHRIEVVRIEPVVVWKSNAIPQAELEPTLPDNG